METGKRSKNFTEKEKMILIEIAKEFTSIIDNKKTDGLTVEAKKQAWSTLTCKFNAVSETGMRTEKQLHALYDNIKKKARRNLSDDKSEMYNTRSGPYSQKTETALDDNVVALLTPQFQILSNEYDSSASDCNLDEQTKEVAEVPPISKRPISPSDTSASKIKEKKGNFSEINKKNISNPSIIKRKNDDSIRNKKLEILEIQRQQELMKLEKTEILFDLDIELKKTLLESAKIDLELKKRNLNV